MIAATEVERQLLRRGPAAGRQAPSSAAPVTADLRQRGRNRVDTGGMDVFSVGLSGLAAAEASFTASARRVATLPVPEEQRPPVDLARELVTQIEARTHYQASLRVLQTGSELSGTLVDMLA